MGHILATCSASHEHLVLSTITFKTIQHRARREVNLLTVFLVAIADVSLVDDPVLNGPMIQPSRASSRVRMAPLRFQVRHKCCVGTVMTRAGLTALRRIWVDTDDIEIRSRFFPQSVPRPSKSLLPFGSPPTPCLRSLILPFTFS